MATKRFPLTRKQFREFVHAKPNRRYEGTNRAASAYCPVAQALNSLAKEKDATSWNVTHLYAWRIDETGGDERIGMPRWAQNFVSRYDSREKGQKATDFI